MASAGTADEKNPTSPTILGAFGRVCQSRWMEDGIRSGVIVFKGGGGVSVIRVLGRATNRGDDVRPETKSDKSPTPLLRGMTRE